MFRFTIRDVLWLTVVVGLAVGWWMDHWQISSFERELLDGLRQMAKKGESGHYPYTQHQKASPAPVTHFDP
jgi:hypothetical protein